MRRQKVYKAKSLKGAERKVRDLHKLLQQCNEVIERFDKERTLLAKLAATGPAFFNPLEAMAAQNVRDRILAQEGMNSDGTFVKRGAQ